MAKSIEIVEVGLRDGLQNESKILSNPIKLQLAQKLIEAGSKRIEIGAFVSPKWVPSMAGSFELTKDVIDLQKKGKISKLVEFSSLVPNEFGMNSAIESGVKEVAVFAACSESFSQKNINCSIAESFNRFKPVAQLAKKNKIKLRGYLSTVFGCPYEGDVNSKIVMQNVSKLIEMGCYEISLGDTIGVATPKQVDQILSKLLKKFPAKKFAGHFHDTRGTALTNILASYEMGIRVFDASIGGLGGCPYAPGAAGNVSTEDVVYFFEKMGVQTGQKLEKLISTCQWLQMELGKSLPSKVSQSGGFLKPKGKFQK